MQKVIHRLTNLGVGGVATWLVFSQLIAAGTSFIVNIIAAYALSPNERGLLAFALQIGYFLTIVALFGTERPFVRKVRSGFDEACIQLTAILRPGYIIPFGLAVAALIAWGMQNLLLAEVAGWLMLMVVGNVHLRVVRAAYIASGARRVFIAVTVLTQALTLGLTALLTVLNVGSFSVWLAAYAVALLAPTLVVAKHVLLAKNVANNNFQAIKQSVRRDGLKLMPASLGNTAMFRSDRLLLPILASPAQLGLYIVVAAAMEVAVWPVQQWSDSKLKSWDEDQKRINRGVAVRLLLKSMIFVLLVSVLLASALVLVILHLLPKEYEESLPLIVPLILANIIYGATRTQQGLSIAAGRSGSVSFAEIAGMVVSVVLYFLLIPSWGAMGAALGSLFGYICCLLFGFLGWQKTTLGERSS